MDIALKQRLVGASVLVALAVVVLPMLLGGRPEEGAGESPAIEVPEQPPELDFETRRYPVGQARPQEQQPEPDQPIRLPEPTLQEPAAETDLAEEPVSDALTVPGTQPQDESTEIPPPGTESAVNQVEEEAVTVVMPEPLPRVATDAGGRYMVQVASFGSVNNAKRLGSELGGLGYTVATDTVSSDVGTLHRVRVGPYGSEADADRAAAALTSQVSGDVTPRVVDLQPGQSAPVTAPSDPMVRWVLQVGSFSSASNADGLVARLRLEGLSAYKESVSSGGKTIYRVRVGPFIERDEAIRTDTLVNDRLSIDGVVMSTD